MFLTGAASMEGQARKSRSSRLRDEWTQIFRGPCPPTLSILAGSGGRAAGPESGGEPATDTVGVLESRLSEEGCWEVRGDDGWVMVGKRLHGGAASRVFAACVVEVQLRPGPLACCPASLGSLSRARSLCTLLRKIPDPGQVVTSRLKMEKQSRPVLSL